MELLGVRTARDRCHEMEQTGRMERKGQVDEYGVGGRPMLFLVMIIL